MILIEHRRILRHALGEFSRLYDVDNTLEVKEVRREVVSYLYQTLIIQCNHLMNYYANELKHNPEYQEDPAALMVQTSCVM